MSKITNKYGHQVWKNEAGQYHRLDGPAYIDANGQQAWLVDGLCHRLDGPAIIHSDGTQSWWVDGMRHRLDGPAYIDANGSHAWFINEFEITDQVNEWMDQMNVDPDYTKWTDTHKVMFKLRFCGN